MVDMIETPPPQQPIPANTGVPGNPVPEPVNPFAPPPGELAGFWVRAGAYVLDRVLYGLVVTPFAIAGATMIFTQFDCVNCATGGDDLELAGSVGLVVAGSMLIALGLIVAGVLFVRALATTGRTWGNRITGIEVVNSAGHPIGWGPALLRTVVSCAVSDQVACIGYLWMLGNPERQTWHDKIARTFVRKVN